MIGHGGESKNLSIFQRLKYKVALAENVRTMMCNRCLAQNSRISKEAATKNSSIFCAPLIRRSNRIRVAILS